MGGSPPLVLGGNCHPSHPSGCSQERWGVQVDSKSYWMLCQPPPLTPSSPGSVNPPPGCLSSGLRRRWRGARALGRLGALGTSPLSMRGWTPEFLETGIQTLRQRPKGRGQPKSDCMIACGRRIIEGSRDTHRRELKNLTSRCGQRGSQNERQSDE